LHANEREIICIICAKGCGAAVVEEEGKIRIRGSLCKNGQEYVSREFRDPRRVLTTTIRVEGGGRLPVRTRGPVAKARLMECMRAINGMRLCPPLEVGDVVAANFLGTGEDLVACGSAHARPNPPKR